MKRSIAFLLFAAMCMFSTAALASQTYRVVVLGAKLLPVKTSQKCWDPCLPVTRKALSELSKRLSVKSSKRVWQSLMSTKKSRSLLQGSKMPDSYAVMQFSNGKKIQTHVVQNSLEPRWGTTESVSLSSKDSVTISLHDKDLKTNDLIGLKSVSKFPARLLQKGGVWKLRFSGVYELELLVVKSKESVLRRFLPGMYQVTVSKGVIAKKKADGRNWDAFRGYPDPFVVLVIGKHRFKTKSASNTLNPIWNEGKVMYLTGKEPFQFYVFDQDISNHDLIGTCFFRQLNHAPMLHRRLFRWKCKQVKQISILFHRIKKY